MQEENRVEQRTVASLAGAAQPYFVLNKSLTLIRTCQFCMLPAVKRAFGGKQMMNAQVPNSPHISLQLQEGIPSRITPRSFYLWGLLLSLAMWITLPSLFLPQKDVQTFLNSFGCDWLFAGILPFLCMAAALVYLVESFSSPVFAYLRHLKTAEDVVTYIQRLKTYPPSVAFSCQCYHTETRTRHVTETYTDANGYTQTRQRAEQYQETVITYSETQPFVFSRWEECSADLTAAIFCYQYTCIDFEIACPRGNLRTEERYNAEKTQFIARNQYRDAGFSFWENCSLHDFTPKMLSIVDIKKKSPLLHWSTYILVTLLMLSWPYRLWFDRSTVYGHFCFQKRIFL